eukprot:9498232-Pyramimonas_sp.AAC.1
MTTKTKMTTAAATTSTTTTINVTTTMATTPTNCATTTSRPSELEARWPYGTPASGLNAPLPGPQGRGRGAIPPGGR